MVRHGSKFIPRDFDVFDLWKQLAFRLPKIPEVGNWHSKNVVQAIGPVLSSQLGHGRHRIETPALLDFAFIRTAEDNAFTNGTSLQGMHSPLSVLYC